MEQDKNREKDSIEEQQEEDRIEQALAEMEMLYQSRCVQPPTASNVKIREI